MVGRSKDGLVAAANRRLYEDMAMLAVASLLLLAGVWVLATWASAVRSDASPPWRRNSGLAIRARGLPPPHPRGELGGLMTLLNGTAESLERQRAAIEELNQKLSQSQKMEAMGQLTGGVAHDFNNLLTVILGNSEYLAETAGGEQGTARDRRQHRDRRRTRLGPDAEPARLRAQAALDAARTSTSARRFSAWSNCCDGRSANISNANSCSIPDLWPASVDPGQLASALLNLVLNARDAMLEGGRLTVEVRNISLGESDVDVNGEARPGDYVMVAVTDTGSGMTAEVASRAFEPFFTTKEVGKGTGLGLSMVYGFAKQSGGSMQIRSEPGHGTAVKLFFPRIDAPHGNDAPPADRSPRLPAARPFSLSRMTTWCARYVEKELKELGYRVIVARNGPAALAILRRPEEIHLLFTDVVMPGGMFGPELARRPPAAAASLEDSLHLRLQRTSRQRARRRPRSADPEQAVPAARPGVDAAFGAEAECEGRLSSRQPARRCGGRGARWRGRAPAASPTRPRKYGMRRDDEQDRR